MQYQNDPLDLIILILFLGILAVVWLWPFFLIGAALFVLFQTLKCLWSAVRYFFDYRRELLEVRRLEALSALGHRKTIDPYYQTEAPMPIEHDYESPPFGGRS